jgi:hypothetical protein
MHINVNIHVNPVNLREYMEVSAEYHLRSGSLCEILSLARAFFAARINAPRAEGLIKSGFLSTV